MDLQAQKMLKASGQLPHLSSRKQHKNSNLALAKTSLNLIKRAIAFSLQKPLKTKMGCFNKN